MKILQYKQKKTVQLNYGNSHKVEYYVGNQNKHLRTYIYLYIYIYIDLERYPSKKI